MSLSYEKLSQTPKNFLQLTGLNVIDFNKIAKLVKPAWEQKEKKKKLDGRPAHLATLKDQLLCLMVYYRTYITHTFLGHLFNLHNSNISRLFKKLEPMVAKHVKIKRDADLTSDKVLSLLVDATEQRTQRPKHGQKAFYSGKKKCHTIKTEIAMEAEGRIVSVSKSHRGSVHDFRIRKAEKPLLQNSIKYADSGYQGLQKLQQNVTLPFKHTKNSKLTTEQKTHNRLLSQIRVKVEHKIREIKIFQIIGGKYRNFQKKHNMRFGIIAALVNLKCGYQT